MRLASREVGTVVRQNPRATDHRKLDQISMQGALFRRNKWNAIFQNFLYQCDQFLSTSRMYGYTIIEISFCSAHLYSNAKAL